MIIGIDASRANRPHKTGTEWYSYYLIRWLAKLDQENQYILYTDKPLTKGLLDLSTAQYVEGEDSQSGWIEYDQDGFQKIKSPYGNFKAKILKWPLRHFWTQGRLCLEMLIHKPGVLFVPSHTLPVFHPKKSLVTIHDVGFENDRCLYSKESICREGGLARRAIDLLARIVTGGKYGANSIDYLAWSTEFALKKARRIITVSEFSKQEIIKIYKADKKKIAVVHNGYNRSLYKKIENRERIEAVLESYGIDGPFLLYIGRLERKKNIPKLIEAFALLKHQNKDFKYKLVLIGNASYGYDEINYLIQEYALDDEVIMPGWVAEEDVPFVYNAAAAFVFPSLYEGFGIPLLQAMASGVPIAASEAASIPEVVGDAALLFDPNDVAAMTKAVSDIVSDARLRAELIEKGFKRAENFSWEKAARETLAVIKSL